MELKIVLVLGALLLNIAVSYGRTLIGRHRQACEPLAGLITVRLPNCRGRIYVNQCIGTCLSWDGLPENADIPANRCTCCKPVTFREKKVLLECTSKFRRRQVEEHTIKEPIACGCSPCNRRRKRSRVSKSSFPSTLKRTSTLQ